MADQMTPSERAAVSARIVATPAGPEPNVMVHEEAAALKVAALVTSRDTGGLRRFLNELEHGNSPWRVEPWRLIAELSELLIRRAARTSSEGHATGEDPCGD